MTWNISLSVMPHVGALEVFTRIKRHFRHCRPSGRQTPNSKFYRYLVVTTEHPTQRKNSDIRKNAQPRGIDIDVEATLKHPEFRTSRTLSQPAGPTLCRRSACTNLTCSSYHIYYASTRYLYQVLVPVHVWDKQHTINSSDSSYLSIFHFHLMHQAPASASP